LFENFREKRKIENMVVSGMIIKINSRKRGSEGVVLVHLSQENFLSIRGFCGHGMNIRIL
jgi:hypothetical protein